MEQQADDNVLTTADIHAQYKTKAPKFEEKISVSDTEDLLALCQKHKAFTVTFYNLYYVLYYVLYYAA